MKGHSGKFVLRLGSTLHQRLRSQSAVSGRSLNAQCVHLLEYALEHQKENLPLDRLHKLTKKILAKFNKNLLGVIIFGSLITQKSFETSDIDLLIVLEKNFAINRKLYQDWDKDLDDGGSPTVNPHFVHLPDLNDKCGSLWLEVATKHEILWQKNSRVTKKISCIKDLIIRQRVRQYETHGQPYWSWEEHA